MTLFACPDQKCQGHRWHREMHRLTTPSSAPTANGWTLGRGVSMWSNNGDTYGWLLGQGVAGSRLSRLRHRYPRLARCWACWGSHGCDRILNHRGRHRCGGLVIRRCQTMPRDAHFITLPDGSDPPVPAEEQQGVSYELDLSNLRPNIFRPTQEIDPE